jgi:heme exporter protein D
MHGVTNVHVRQNFTFAFGNYARVVWVSEDDQGNHATSVAIVTMVTNLAQTFRERNACRISCELPVIVGF